MMKIAIPTRNQFVDEHFGHCEYFTVVTISENKEIVDTTTLQSPESCGCKSGIADTLADMNVTVMLAGNMGQGAVNKISGAGIEVYRGCKGKVKDVINEFLNDHLADSGETCHHHEDGHTCHSN